MADKAENLLYETLKQAMARALPHFSEPARALLSDRKSEQLLHFLTRVLEVNQQMNLTAITDPDEMMRLHLLDSLTILPIVQAEMAGKADTRPFSLLDLGSGAGFPGMPLKIFIPAMDLSFLDALQKRVRFLRETATAIGLDPPWQALHGRSEDLARQPAYRESYDLVVARAVAPLPLLLEYALGLPGGRPGCGCPRSGKNGSRPGKPRAARSLRRRSPADPGLPENGADPAKIPPSYGPNQETCALIGSQPVFSRAFRFLSWRFPASAYLSIRRGRRFFPSVSAKPPPPQTGISPEICK